MSRIAFIISAIMLAALWGCENNGSSAGNTLASDDIAEDDERERPSRDEARAKRTKSKREKRPAREDRRPPPRSKSKADIPAPDDVSEPPSDAERTKSGLASKVLKAGSGGENPNPTDTTQNPNRVMRRFPSRIPSHRRALDPNPGTRPPSIPKSRMQWRIWTSSLKMKKTLPTTRA